MKRIKYFANFAFLCLLAVNPVISQTRESRNLDDFTAVSVGEAINVVLVAGGVNKAELSVTGIDLDEVLTEVSGTKLRIHLDNGRHNNVEVDITLTYKTIEWLKISSAADVKTRGPIKTTNFEVTVSSAAEADLDLEVSTLEVDVSSAGELHLSGTATSQNVEVSSAGTYNGSALKSQETVVKASSAGSARVQASKRIDARASSGGSVKYSGDPDKVRESSSSGGHVRGN